MGRTNRSRKRKAEMDRIKKERNSKKELLRLKKTLGLLDEHGNELIKKMEEVVEYKTPEQLRKEKQEKEEQEILDEIAEEKADGEIVEVKNETTGVVHKYNTKTMRDQFGSLPVWKTKRNTERKVRKKTHAMKKQFNQAWLNKFVPI
ncbi:protein LLP homolog [Sitodiplosis mosellana]|uniref:protein LLP homolog n=1 Tax=Sitodiplosis mosellana TaxID=263140 RepID=UPI002444662B|nr:protein LLP homolog [Sitodiplosis mosellana]